VPHPCRTALAWCRNASSEGGHGGKLETSDPMTKEIPNPKGRAGEPISLHPLKFEEAVAGLAQVKMPEPEKKKPKITPKKGK
jgi:hypothetical protein